MAALSLTTVAGASTNPDLAAEFVECRLPLGTAAVAAGKFAHPLFGDADGRQGGRDAVAQAGTRLNVAQPVDRQLDAANLETAAAARRAVVG